MKILIDTADVTVIRRLYQIYPFDGVTTNPRLLSRITGKPMEILKEIQSEIPESAELHVQVVSSDSTEMLKEAEYIGRTLGKNVHIKVPVCEAGYQVIQQLAKDQVKVTATAIFQPIQALLAAAAGAYSVAPYIHRINNKGGDGIEVASDIQRLLEAHGYQTRLLAAAFENVRQVSEILAFGAKSVTVAPELLNEMLRNDLTEMAVTGFYQEFKEHFQMQTMII